MLTELLFLSISCIRREIRANKVLKYNLYLVGLWQFSKSTWVRLLSLFHMCDLITFPIFNGIMKTVFTWQHLQLCKCQNNAKKPPAFCGKNYLG